MATVTPYDGARLPDSDVLALHGVIAAALAADRPEDPVPSVEAVGHRLRAVRGGRRTFRWIAREGGTPVGHLVLDLPRDDNTHLGLFDAQVHPEHRRRGTGTALVREAVRVAAAHGRRSLLVEAYEGSVGAAFTAALGLRPVQNEQLSLLRLADVDRADVAGLAAAPHPGYRLERWVDHVPDALLERFAVAKSTMNDAPTGDMDWTGRDYTPRAVRDEEDLFRALGRQLRVVVAVHGATGDIAALTEVAVFPDPRRSQQEDTAVVPAHRGRGLGLWVKADMLRWLPAERPDVAELLTGNADDNAHMLRINTRLGFRPYALLQEWQADVRALAGRLAA